MEKKNKKALALMLVFIMCMAAPALAQEKSADEIARELANPNNSLASLTFKNQYRWYTGDLPHAEDQGNYTLLFQPVFPFPGKLPAGGKDITATPRFNFF